jgi:hypothetical protein
MSLTKDAVENLLRRLIDDVKSSDPADLNSKDSGFLVLNDFALLNLIKNEIIKLRSDYSHLTELKNEFTTDIKKIGTELVRNAENRALEVKRSMDSYEEKICQQLESDIYRTFRRHFNTNLKDLLLSQPEKILTGEFNDVVAKAIRSTTSDALVKEMHDTIELLKRSNESLKEKVNMLQSRLDAMEKRLATRDSDENEGEDKDNHDSKNSKKTDGDSRKRQKHGEEKKADRGDTGEQKSFDDKGADRGDAGEQKSSDDKGSDSGESLLQKDADVSGSGGLKTAGDKENSSEVTSDGADETGNNKDKKKKLSLNRSRNGNNSRKSANGFKKHVVRGRGKGR